MGRLKEFMMNGGIKGIVTKRNEDGTYDEVGMNNRALFIGSEKSIMQSARDFARGKPFRVELWSDSSFYVARPYRTQEFK